MKLDLAIAKINKKFGENMIGFAKDLKYADVPRLPSGSLFLDWALGSNKKSKTAGWPLGRIVELYGPESSGKSLISMKTIAEAQKAGFECAYLDCENTFDRTFAETLGVDASKLLITRESQGETLIDMVCDLLKESADLRIVVFDSLAAMIPKVEVEDPLEQSQMAPMARMMSKGLRKLNASNKHGALIIFINQLRENPGAAYGNPEYTPGGKALKYYSSLRVEVRKGDWILKGEGEDGENAKQKIGQMVKFKIAKNKTDVPLREGYFKFLYTGEIDRIDELISLGILNNKITRRGAYYDLGSHSWQGRESMEVDLKKDAGLFEEARKAVFE